MLDQTYHPKCHVEVAGTGFTVLDRVYEDGGLAKEALGGSCGNVLVSLAMLRRHVAPVLALGADETGNRLVDEFVAAGATTKYISRRTELRSPILAQKLDTTSGRHDFSFVCPETSEELPRYQPISEEEFTYALPMLAHCSVFYTDRLTINILEAMKAASASGAIVVFEPSSIGEPDHFEEALKLSNVLKYSEDRLGDDLKNRDIDCVRIVTYGAEGLEVSHRDETIWCTAIHAPAVMDTCGSGDMVSVGLIDWMLNKNLMSDCLSIFDLIDGVVAGQRLAAANCAYAGARGLFKSRGASYVRQILNENIAEF